MHVNIALTLAAVLWSGTTLAGILAPSDFRRHGSNGLSARQFPGSPIISSSASPSSTGIAEGDGGDEKTPELPCGNDDGIDFAVAFQKCVVTGYRKNPESKRKNSTVRTIYCDGSKSSRDCSKWEEVRSAANCSGILTCREHKAVNQTDHKQAFCSFPNCCDVWHNWCTGSGQNATCAWHCVNKRAKTRPPPPHPPPLDPKFPPHIPPRDVASIMVPDDDGKPQDASGMGMCTKYDIDHDEPSAGVKPSCLEWSLNFSERKKKPWRNCQKFPNCCNHWQKYCHIYEGQKICTWLCIERSDPDKTPDVDNPGEGGG